MYVQYIINSLRHSPSISQASPFDPPGFFAGVLREHVAAGQQTARATAAWFFTSSFAMENSEPMDEATKVVDQARETGQLKLWLSEDGLVSVVSSLIQMM